VQRIKVAQRKLHVAGFVPLSYVAVAKARQPDHVEHERHTDDPGHGCAGGPNPGEPLARYVWSGDVVISLIGTPPERASQAGPHPSPTIGDAGRRLQVGDRSSVFTSPDRNQRAASRETLRRSRRPTIAKTSARVRIATVSSFRARSASRIPWCFARKRRCDRNCSRYIRDQAWEVDAPPAWTNSTPGQKSTLQPAARAR
jgi:hypothetical protein